MLKVRRFAFMVLAAVMMFSLLPATAHAREREQVEIAPFWQNVSAVDVTLSFNGTTANMYAGVFALSGTTSISGTVTLARRVGNSFVTVGTWPVSSTNHSLIFRDNVTVTSGNTYRLSISATVTRNGVAENVSNSIENTVR